MGWDEDGIFLFPKNQISSSLSGSILGMGEFHPLHMTLRRYGSVRIKVITIILSNQWRMLFYASQS